jgi:hypothetical protein
MMSGIDGSEKAKDATPLTVSSKMPPQEHLILVGLGE